MTTEHVDARPILASALVTGIDHVGIAVPDLDAAKAIGQAEMSALRASVSAALGLG